MHEMTLCRNIMTTLQQTIDGIHRLSKITIAVGDLAAVDSESLAFWFPIIAAEYGLDRVELAIDVISAVAQCQQCDYQFSLKQRLTDCPICGGYQYQLMAGEELFIKTVEVD